MPLLALRLLLCARLLCSLLWRSSCHSLAPAWLCFYGWQLDGGHSLLWRSCTLSLWLGFMQRISTISNIISHSR